MAKKKLTKDDHKFVGERILEACEAGLKGGATALGIGGLGGLAILTGFHPLLLVHAAEILAAGGGAAIVGSLGVGGPLVERTARRRARITLDRLSASGEELRIGDYHYMKAQNDYLRVFCVNPRAPEPGRAPFDIMVEFYAAVKNDDGTMRPGKKYEGVSPLTYRPVAAREKRPGLTAEGRAARP